MPTGIAGLLAGYGEEKKKQHDQAHQEELAQKQMATQILMRAADNPNITIDEQRELMNHLGDLWGTKAKGGLFGIKALGGRSAKAGPRFGDLIFPQASVDRQIQSGTKSETLVPGDNGLTPPPSLPVSTNQIDPFSGDVSQSAPYVNPSESGPAPSMTREIPAYLRYGQLTPSKIASDQALQQRVAELKATQPFKLDELSAQYGLQVQAHNKGVDYANQNTWDIERIIPTKGGGGEIIWRNKAGESKSQPLSGDQYQFFRDPNNPIDQKIMGYASVIKNQNPNLSDEETVKRANALYMRGVNADIGASEALAEQRKIAPPPAEAEQYRFDRNSAKEARDKDAALILTYSQKTAELKQVEAAEAALTYSLGLQGSFYRRRLTAERELEDANANDDGTKESQTRIRAAERALEKRKDDEADAKEKLDLAKSKVVGLRKEVEGFETQITTGRQRLKEDYPQHLIIPDDIGKPVRMNNKTKPPQGSGGGRSSNSSGGSNDSSNNKGNGYSPAKLDAVRQRLQN